MRPKRKRANGVLSWTPQRPRHRDLASGACCQDNSRRLRHLLSQSSSGLNCLRFTYNSSGLCAYLSAIRYRMYLSSGEYFGGCGSIVVKLHFGHWCLRVYVLHEGHFRTRCFISYSMPAEECETFSSLDVQD